MKTEVFVQKLIHFKLNSVAKIDKTRLMLTWKLIGVDNCRKKKVQYIPSLLPCVQNMNWL